MTTPAMLVPGQVYEAPYANPVPGGLYGAATVEVVSDPARLSHGIELWTPNCGGVQTFDPRCGETVADKAEQGARAGTDFPSLGIVAADECFLGRTEQEAQERAAQTLRLQEQPTVEAWFASSLLDDAGTAASADGTGVLGLIAAVGAIELALGARGVPGVIHASASLAALAVHANVAKPSGAGRYVSPLGHAWAFGGGYGALGTTIVGTGPVTVMQSSVVTGLGHEVRRNTRLAIAEREVAVGYECAAVAAEVS